MRAITQAFIHCSDTYTSMDIGAETIRDWHVNERGWSDIGYHWVIRRDGSLEAGRDESITGAHARGYNNLSIAVCLVGGKADDDSAEFNFTQAQMAALSQWIEDKRKQYPGINFRGHNEVSKKTCPNFNVAAFVGND